MDLLNPEDPVTTPEECWNAILRILELDPSKTVIGNLAAGPLEDLIEYHGPSFISTIESESKKNLQFKYLLGGVWKSSTPEIWARVQACREDAW